MTVEQRARIAEGVKQSWARRRTAKIIVDEFSPTVANASTVMQHAATAEQRKVLRRPRVKLQGWRKSSANRPVVRRKGSTLD